MEHDAVGLGRRCCDRRLCRLVLLFLLRLVDRAGDVLSLEGFLASGKIQIVLRPGRSGRGRLIVEHVSAIDHEAGDLQHHEAEDRNQDYRYDANVTEGFHAARPSDLLRSENACAAAATALAADTLAVTGSGADAGADAGRAAIAILDSRRTTLSPSTSCRF